MNYYRFLDSRDIRNHLENMEYPLSTPEAAYLVWQCRRVTLEEKFAAWEEIVDTMPDSAIIGRPFGGRERVDSVHQFLRDYIAFQKQRLVEFSQPGRWVYTAQFFHEKSAQWSDLGHFFTIYQDCLDACREATRGRMTFEVRMSATEFAEGASTWRRASASPPSSRITATSSRPPAA